jgi:hypothetical protein
LGNKEERKAMFSPKEMLWFTRHNKHAILSDTGVWRKGVTATEWDKGADIVGISRSKDRDNSLSLTFSIPSKGGGDTEIDVIIGRKDFPTLLALMSAADEQSTLKAIAEELRHQICGPDGPDLMPQSK